MNRWGFVLVALVFFIVGSVTAQTVLPPDVPPTHPAAQDVIDLLGLNVMRVYPDGLFRGDRLLTRYEAAQALNRVRKLAPTGGGSLPTGTVGGTVLGLPNLIVARFADGSATMVPITWGTCYAYYACREPFKPFPNGATSDEMRVGLFEKFIGVWVTLQTPATSGALVWEYRTGGGVWSPILGGLQDGTNGFRQSGMVRFPATMPSDWAKVSIESSEPLYWVRARVTATISPVPVTTVIGVPIIGASLTFRGAALWSGTSNSEGRYTTPQLPAGAYVVDLQATGWKALTFLVPVTGNQTTAVNIGPQGP